MTLGTQSQEPFLRHTQIMMNFIMMSCCQFDQSFLKNNVFKLDENDSIAKSEEKRFVSGLR